MRTMLPAIAAISGAAVASAATVHFNVNTNTGDSPVDYNIVVNDDTAGYFHFAVEVAASSPNNGDVSAIYFDFSQANAYSGYSASDFSGSAITDVEFDSRNVQTGNIGQKFQFALAIGAPGSGSDFYDSFTFSMAVRNGLVLADLDMFGVRAQSVGAGASWANPGGNSSKTFVGPGQPPLDATPVPLPTASGLAGLGLVALAARRRRASI